MTTLCTLPRTNSIRAAFAGLRMRARRCVRTRRRPVRVRGDLALRHGARAAMIKGTRVAVQRLRPEPPLRGFLPLYRH
ncbi:MAG: hypothetical protein ABI881_07575 [Betaproteobacteria bacterium]